MGTAKEILSANRQVIPGDKDEFFVDLHIPLEQFNAIVRWGEYVVSVGHIYEKELDYLQDLVSMQSDIKKYMKK